MEYKMILCIVNSGFSELAMDAAREAGAHGGTIIDAHGTAREDAEEYFHISIHPEKEMLMILVKSDICDNVLHALYKSVGLDSEGQGIAFAVNVDNVIGLKGE